MISFRCSVETKERLVAASERLGYENLSEYILDVLDGVSRPVVQEGWDCRLLHMQGDRVVGVGEEGPSLPLPVAAYPVVGPVEFWKSLQSPETRSPRAMARRS
jgi:hypothetical protein